MEAIHIILSAIVIIFIAIEIKKSLKNSRDFKLYINKHKFYSYEKTNRIN